MNQKTVIISLAIFLLATLPMVALAADFAAGDRPNLNLGANTQTIINIITKIFSIFWIVFIAFAIIMFIWAGILFLKADGEPGELATARKALLWGVIGVIVAVAAFSIPYFIRNTVWPAGSCSVDADCNVANGEDCLNGTCQH